MNIFSNLIKNNNKSNNIFLKEDFSSMNNFFEKESAFWLLIPSKKLNIFYFFKLIDFFI
jgi:hypothetical protein